jgi:hypothetical protein
MAWPNAELKYPDAVSESLPQWVSEADYYDVNHYYPQRVNHFHLHRLLRLLFTSVGCDCRR